MSIQPDFSAEAGVAPGRAIFAALGLKKMPTAANLGRNGRKFII